MKKIISLEGAWAGGKTSILREIGKLGERTYQSIVPVIYDIKGREEYSPRKDPEEFTKLFLRLKEAQCHDALTKEGDILFFDRVFFAPIVLRRFLGLEVPGEFYELLKAANLSKTIFLVEPIPLEMHKDGWPRKHFSYEESLVYHKITEEVILEQGFQVERVPYLVSAEERAKLILSKVNTTIITGSEEQDERHNKTIGG
ncbi:AAA family ATPase [Candidatus Kuenenbacteria bacterium]|nr:AAA family ATPase [Candidatus Kuenenbacteria bacterium]HOZ36935.1 AAA family ATPase [bacterium]